MEPDLEAWVEAVDKEEWGPGGSVPGAPEPGFIYRIQAGQVLPSLWGRLFRVP